MSKSTRKQPSRKVPSKQLADQKQGLVRDRRKLDKLRQSDPKIAKVIEEMVATTESAITQLEAEEKLQTNKQQKADSKKPKKTRSEKPTKSKSRSKSVKPDKSYDGFPLFPHATKHWAKTIRGKFHYVGPWDNPEAALEKFNREWPYLSAGRTPAPVDRDDGCTL